VIEKKAESIYKPTDNTKKLGNSRASYPLDPDKNLNPFFLRASKDEALKAITENSIGSALVGAMVDGVIGSGITLEAAPSDSILTMNADKVAKNAQRIEEMWHLWSTTPEACDVAEEQTLGAMVRVAGANAYSTGDVLQYIGIRNWQGVYVPVIRFYDGRVVEAQSGDDTIAGVRVDKSGNTTGYSIKQEGKGLGSYEYKTVDRFDVYPDSNDKRVQYNLVLAGKVQPNQKRGRSLILPAINDIIMLEKFSEAQMVKAVVQSYITAFIERDKELIDHSGAFHSGIDPLLGQLEEDAKAGEVGDYDQPITMGPGYVQTLAPGERLVMADSKSPVTEFWAFMEGNIKLIAAATRTPFEVALMAFNSNYSASQAAIQAAARTWDIERKLFAMQTMQPIYNLFVYLMVIQGLVDCPKYLENPFVRAAWNNANWHGPVILNIDPVKNATAATLRLNNMTSTYEDESRNLGRDFDKVVARRRLENQMMKENGLISNLTVEKKDVEEGSDE